MQLNKNHVSKQSEALVEKVLNKIEGIKKPRKYFMLSIFSLFLSLRGRYTFKGLERYSSRSEKSYRLHFEEEFDFLEFNATLCQSELSEELIIAFDPCYLPKSGKHTPHIGKYWSGCLGQAVKGIEIGGLGVVDIKYNTAFNLESVQTPSPKMLSTQEKTLVDHYAQVILHRAETLCKLSNYLVVDGYFAKKAFIDPIRKQTEIHLISKLRKDANLKYLFTGVQNAGRGRPKQYDGKVNWNQINKNKFQQVHQDNQVIIYEATLWAVGLKHKFKVAYVEFLDKGKPTNRYAIYFSTDLNLDAFTIYKYYKARFQIEFLFRDAKQFTGLTHCQARSENKIHFHTNVSLTAVGIAKIVHYIQKSKTDKNTFSIANIKTSYFNEIMFNLFLDNFQIDPHLIKNKLAIEQFINFGKIAS